MSNTNNMDAVMFMNYRRLRHISRCNNFMKNSKEDVAQHSYYVSIISMIISDELNNADIGFKVNTEKVLRYALLHDTEEAITSDVPYNVKHRNPDINKRINQVLSEVAEDAYSGTSDLFMNYLYLSKSSKEGIEGDIVDVADMLELAIYCYEEVLMGNILMKSLMDKAIRLTKAKPQVIIDTSKFVQDAINMMESDSPEVKEELLIL